ncbi:hypothetical protein F4Z99_18810 [Candidatus Poribacteria bacterium]|nr:hypothetical protein [Candidatus Poribacteria bacterium]MYA99178.1 hypothetical protein [Candidatus Poribacteria bacterium]
MKYLQCLGYLSIVWSLALTGCGAKPEVLVPFAAQRPIHLQAKAAAESDAKRHAEVLTYFGTGMGMTFAAAMCGLMTGFVADVTLGNGQDAPFYLPAATSAAGAFSLLLQYAIRPSNPPPERLIGKSPAYVEFYADAYRTRMRAYQTKSVAAGAVFGCLTLAGGVAIIADQVSAER